MLADPATTGGLAEDLKAQGIPSILATNAHPRSLALKLERTREEMQRVRGQPARGNLAVGEPVTRTLRSIYFDTPDHRLRALGISLRLRSDGESWLQTVKSGTAVVIGVFPADARLTVELALAGAPAPHMIYIHGGLATVIKRGESFERFLAGLGYPGHARKRHLKVAS